MYTLHINAVAPSRNNFVTYHGFPLEDATNIFFARSISFTLSNFDLITARACPPYRPCPVSRVTVRTCYDDNIVASPCNFRLWKPDRNVVVVQLASQSVKRTHAEIS